MTRASGGIYVIMGVAGSGKTRIGSAFARALGVEFVEGDDHHPAANVALMSRGIPLTDSDRAGWLAELARCIHEASEAGRGLVIACSALKRSYRDLLRTAGTPGEVVFVFLRGPRTLIAERLATRRGHFMPASLLDSQLATLEEPALDEGAWVCDISDTPDDLVAALVARASA